ncbi:hypothetical protein [Streptomyces sp. NPDC048606]|uniref:hypothetical protein n=1 Tax=Streptomyces sp. NPDC048606 TaxID=3154726 RepID=UPI003421C8CF
MSGLLLASDIEVVMFRALLDGLSREDAELRLPHPWSLAAVLRDVRARTGLPPRTVALGAVATGQIKRPSPDSFALDGEIDETAARVLRAWIAHTGPGLPDDSLKMKAVETARHLRRAHRRFGLALTASEITLTGAALAHKVISVGQWQDDWGWPR